MSDFVFKKADLGDRPIYVDQLGCHWLFYKCRGLLEGKKFVRFADTDPASFACGWYEGMRRAKEVIGYASIQWLTPDVFEAWGGKFSD